MSEPMNEQARQWFRTEGGKTRAVGASEGEVLDAHLRAAAHETNRYAGCLMAECNAVIAELDRNPERWEKECLGFGPDGRPAIVPRLPAAWPK